MALQKRFFPVIECTFQLVYNGFFGRDWYWPI
jgi:hypothetical protein